MDADFLDASRNPLTAAMDDDDEDDCTRLIPETRALLARMESLSTAEMRTLARNLEMLVQCAEEGKARRTGFARP